MIQPALFASPRPPDLRSRGIDLRCCDTAEMMASLDEGCADLVICDPPWSYVQEHGETGAGSHYDCLPMSAIAAHVSQAYRLAPLMAFWVTFPLLGEWMAQETPWGAPVTGGSWHKSGPNDSGHYGQGYWMSGCAELFLLYKHGKPNCDRAAALRNAWHEPPGLHSRKPARWQAQMIKRWVPPGGLVVDVYGGLASVAEAVLLAGEGRRYVGAEINPQRHADALALLAQVRTA